jgi:hypothetical protein
MLQMSKELLPGGAVSTTGRGIMPTLLNRYRVGCRIHRLEYLTKINRCEVSCNEDRFPITI